MKYLFDASALLAILFDEPGRARAIEFIDDAAITSVNLAEVVGQLVRQGRSDANIEESLAILQLSVIPVDETDGRLAGRLLRMTKEAGLSLGDRCCLAVARRRALIAISSDRAWARVAAAVGVEIELIR